MPFIEGYLNSLSATPGETVYLSASSDSDNCWLDIFREGLNENRVHEQEAINVGEHPVPEQAWELGPDWPACWEFTIPHDWPSGIYRIELHAHGDRGQPKHTRWCAQHAQHDILLVVRAVRPASQHMVLLQLTTNTYMAYNSWGGKSTYPYNSTDGAKAHRVSLLRPGHGYYGDTIARAEFPQWELPFIRWCEKNRIGLEYGVNYDLERWPDGFEDYRLILSVGHDEYWSGPMRDNLERFIAAGGNAAFFSGNTCCWQVRFEDEGNTMVTYKEDYQQDPEFASGRHHLVSTLWSHPLVGRPENQLTGVGFPMGGYHRFFDQYRDQRGEHTVRLADHWIFDGTGLTEGDTFGGSDAPPNIVWEDVRLAERALAGGPRGNYDDAPIIGYECDGCAFEEIDGYPVSTGADGTPESFVILAQCHARWTRHEVTHPVFLEAGVSTKGGRATMGVYVEGGTVFTAGTTDWAYGLNHDLAVQRITRNILERLGK